MNRKILVLTGTRAEYGLLKNIMFEINKSKKLTLQLVVTGSHLSKTYGETVNEIVKDGFEIDDKISILMKNGQDSDNAKEMGLLMIQLSQTISRLKPDFLLVLGDRYEILAAVSVASVMNVPIAHISGGEITEGAIDDQIRHAITKLSHIHFPGAAIYGQNIKNMGEEDWRIFNVGDPGIENIKLTNFLSAEELFNEINIRVDRDTLLITFHPVTHEKNDIENQINNLIKALDKIDKKMIITYPNADNGGDIIIERLNSFADKNKNVYLFKNLGIQKYLSVMKLCGCVLGNSSSAIVEAPYFKVPAINIGNRQKGRLMADNIISCSNETLDIIAAIKKAYSDEFLEIVKRTKSLYGDGNTSLEIVKILEDVSIDDNLLKKKLTWS